MIVARPQERIEEAHQAQHRFASGQVAGSATKSHSHQFKPRRSARSAQVPCPPESRWRIQHLGYNRANVGNEDEFVRSVNRADHPGFSILFYGEEQVGEQTSFDAGVVKIRQAQDRGFDLAAVLDSNTLIPPPSLVVEKISLQLSASRAFSRSLLPVFLKPFSADPIERRLHMKYVVAVVLLALLGGAAIWAQNRSGKVSIREKPAITPQKTGAATTPVAPNEVRVAVEKGAKWLASVQGSDGGWGQDGGAASHVRQTDRLESNGNDVANTAVAALALLRAGNEYRPNVERAVDFILQRVEASPTDGLSITNVKDTQIQRKLGPFIDTFLASMLLAQVDGTLAGANKARVRRGLEKCVAKIERNQQSDGSWNVGGGWAPVLGTSLASRSLDEAGKKGVKVDREVMARASTYTLKSQKARDSVGSGRGGGVGAGSGRGSGAGKGSAGEARILSESVALSAAAGVPLYQDAQALEQLSRTEEDRKKNANEIAAINGRLSDTKFVEGYGSIGGEEFFSYLNISDSLKRTGGKGWSDWHSKISDKILKLQNNDGTWAGHHCITGRVAVTSAAILNLTSDRGN